MEWKICPNLLHIVPTLFPICLLHLIDQLHWTQLLGYANSKPFCNPV